MQQPPKTCRPAVRRGGRDGCAVHRRGGQGGQAASPARPADRRWPGHRAGAGRGRRGRDAPAGRCPAQRRRPLAGNETATKGRLSCSSKTPPFRRAQQGNTGFLVLKHRLSGVHNTKERRAFSLSKPPPFVAAGLAGRVGRRPPGVLRAVRGPGYVSTCARKGRVPLATKTAELHTYAADCRSCFASERLETCDASRPKTSRKGRCISRCG